MALLTMTRNPEKITLPANTDEHTLDVSAFVVDYTKYEALIRRRTGSFQIDATNNTITAANDTLDDVNDRTIIDVTNDFPIRLKGAAGSEQFSIQIIQKK